ncbi:MAG: collagen binding domain-containing protein [Thermoanaerobaculia bacterium]
MISILLLADLILIIPLSSAIGCEPPGQFDGGQEVRIARPADLESGIVRCDGEGLEPLDVAAIEPGPVEVQEARPVRLESETPIDGSLEWRAAAPRGTRLIARRPLRFTVEVFVPVARSERILRVIRPGYSPSSVLVPPSAEEIAIASPVEGGELAIQVRPASFRPISFEIRGVRSPYSDWWFASGLPSGEHGVTAVYEGEVRSDHVPFRVVKGETSEYSWQLPDTGGLSVVVARCEGMIGPRLALEPRGRAPSEVPVGADCSARFEGLSEGTVLLRLLEDGEQEPTAEETVAVRVGELIDVRIETKEIVVRGLVTRGDTRPVADAYIRFSGPSGYRTAETSKDGRFELSLPAPGEYRIDVQSSLYVPAFAVYREIAESGEVHLKLPPGRLVVTARGSSGEIREHVQVHLKTKSGFLTAAIATYPELEAVFLGLEPETYVLSASAPGGWVTRSPSNVVITESDDDVAAEVTLDRITATLHARDAQGSPLHAKVNAGGLVVSPSERGVYPLRGVAPGQPIAVSAPGHTPVCRIFEGTDVELNLLPPAFMAVVHLPVDLPMTLGEIAGLPASNCAVRLHDFHARVEYREDSQVVSIPLPVGNYQYRASPERPWVPIHVPGPSVSVNPQ